MVLEIVGLSAPHAQYDRCGYVCYKTGEAHDSGVCRAATPPLVAGRVGRRAFPVRRAAAEIVMQSRI